MCAPTFPDLNPVDNSMWEIVQENVYKTCLLATSEFKSSTFDGHR